MSLIIIIGIIIAAIIFLIGLSCYIFGFRSVGVAAGSCAASCQSCIGNVVKGSCFAIMTSLGMRGCFVIMIVIGIVALASFGIYSIITSEWFQHIINWFGDSFNDAYDWVKNIFSKSQNKFLSSNSVDKVIYNLFH